MDRMWSRAAAVFHLLCLSVTLTSLRAEEDDMMCFYCPLLEKEKAALYSAPNILTEALLAQKHLLLRITCAPSQVCYDADGRYGNYSALSSKGCVARERCDQVGSVLFKGVVYSQHYTCCDDRNFCNAGPCVTAKCFPLVLTLLALGHTLYGW